MYLILSRRIPASYKKPSSDPVAAHGGKMGSGKSTLSRLVSDSGANEGSILIDGVDVRQIAADLRKTAQCSRKLALLGPFAKISKWDLMNTMMTIF